ncbi:MAG: roadblock/LC7 domain-containing protein [Candidatus Hydrothermae bacterium]|nr:roadblock/LC7 domain-containing protein [Candidatus Hydrothermae bacterium]
MGGIATQMREVLEKLLKRTPDIQVAAVVSAEGLMMMSAPDYEDEELLAALASSMMFQGERVVKDLGKGDLEQVLV